VRPTGNDCQTGDRVGLARLDPHYNCRHASAWASRAIPATSVEIGSAATGSATCIEFFDMHADPKELTNLAARTDLAEVPPATILMCRVTMYLPPIFGAVRNRLAEHLLAIQPTGPLLTCCQIPPLMSQPDSSLSPVCLR
jgi:hypothetical protein